EDGIRDRNVTGVQTCALPIFDRITEETLLFEGPATEACRAFPANVNVLAALSLAGIGPEKTRIKLYAVPGLTMNRHRITVVGEFGRLAIEVENVPSENPRTGKLSYMSTIALLRELTASLPVGTSAAVSVPSAAGSLRGTAGRRAQPCSPSPRPSP